MISSARHRAGGGSRRRRPLLETVTTAVVVTFLVLIVTAPSAPFTCMAQSTTQASSASSASSSSSSSKGMVPKFQPVMVPTLTEAEFVQHVQPSTHIMLIALVHEHTLQELQFSNHNIFINRWQQHHGRAFYVFCGISQSQAQSTSSSNHHNSNSNSISNSFCRTLLETVVDTKERGDGEKNRKQGGLLQLNRDPTIPTYLRWDGAGVLEIYQGIGSLQGLYEWSVRLPGGSDFIRNHPDYSFGGIIPSGRDSGSGVLSPQQDADEIVVFKQFIVDAPEDAIFVEYGTGGSTHTAAVTMHGTQIWHSIEQNQVWVEQVRAGMPSTTSATAQTQVHVHHIQPYIPYRGHPDQEHLEVRVIGHYREEIAMGMEEFIFADQVQPPIDWAKVHLVFVDGLARGATLVTITDRVPPGTTVLLHDYVGRQSWYDWAIRSGQYQRMQLVNSMLVLKTTVKKNQDTSHNSDTCKQQ